jgi:lauroyl/myristoyl acyltransferase
MAQLLDDAHLSKRELATAAQRYFEVIYCDQIDRFVYAFGWQRSFIRKLKVEGVENLNEALKNKGGILLSAHFGGGFWILPFLKDLGVKTHFFALDVERENYPHQTPLYLYYRLGSWAIEKASGGRVLYKSERRRGFVEALRGDKWVIALFDVPPFLVKEKMEALFLGKKTWFPKGIISIGKEMNVPILPFFSYLDKNCRKICFEKPIYVKDEGKCFEECVRLVEKRILERPDHWHLWPSASQFFVQ